jgi:TRAP-type C4-dicarboxylate transport system permease small subunit
MGSMRVLAVVLVVAGMLALAYGGFTYTKETHDAKVGPIEMSVKERETVNIPMWAGILAVGAGLAILLVPEKTD